MIVTLEDKFAINELINLYGHIIDRQEFNNLNQIFTNDAAFDLSLFQFGKVYQGLDQIIAMMEQSSDHPVAHHATNIVIQPNFDEAEKNNSKIIETVHVVSKGIGVGRKGRVGSVVYHDALIKKNDQWRIQHRTIQHLAEPGSQL